METSYRRNYEYVSTIKDSTVLVTDGNEFWNRLSLSVALYRLQIHTVYYYRESNPDNNLHYIDMTLYLVDIRNESIGVNIVLLLFFRQPCEA